MCSKERARFHPLHFCRLVLFVCAPRAGAGISPNKKGLSFLRWTLALCFARINDVVSSFPALTMCDLGTLPESLKDTPQHVSGVFETRFSPGRSLSSRSCKRDGNESVVIDFGRNFSLSGMIASLCSSGTSFRMQKMECAGSDAMDWKIGLLIRQERCANV